MNIENPQRRLLKDGLSWRGPEVFRAALYATFPVLERCKNRGRTTVLETTHNHPIMISNSPPLIQILALGGNLLVEINNRVDNEAAQVIMEDQAEGVVRRRVTIEEGGVFRVAGEFYEEGEDIVDILQ